MSDHFCLIIFMKNCTLAIFRGGSVRMDEDDVGACVCVSC